MLESLQRRYNKTAQQSIRNKTHSSTLMTSCKFLSTVSMVWNIVVNRNKTRICDCRDLKLVCRPSRQAQLLAGWFGTALWSRCEASLVTTTLRAATLPKQDWRNRNVSLHFVLQLDAACFLNAKIAVNYFMILSAGNASSFAANLSLLKEIF